VLATVQISSNVVLKEPHSLLNCPLDIRRM
jgi:hypothetical protein